MFVNLLEADLAAAEVKLALEAIGLQERKAIERFFALVRKSTPQMRAMAERYGGDVSFNFDSNGRSVWVVALFGKGAPPVALLRRAQDRPCGPPQVERERRRDSLDDEQDEGGNEEEG